MAGLRFRRTPLSLALVGAAGLLALTGCSGSSAPPSAAATSTPTPTPSPTLSPHATPTATPTPSATPSDVRPVAQPARNGDVDGDGRVDRVSVADGVAGSEWQVVVRLTALGRVTAVVHDDTDRPFVAGVVDADGDGFAEIWMHSGAGASTELLTPLRLAGEEIGEMTIRGEPAQLAVGGTVTHGNGFACRDADSGAPGDELVVYEGQFVDASTFAGEQTVYGWHGTRLVPLDHRSRSFAATGPDDDRVRPYYAVDCGALGE